MDLEKHIAELLSEGVTLVPGAYSKAQCQASVTRFEHIIERFKQEKRPLSEHCQIIENPFRHDAKLAELIYHEAIDALLCRLLDPDYVLINSNVINRRLREDIVTGGIDIGQTWHTDSRYLNSRRMEHGFGYIACTMFSDFTPDNGATQYVPKSHLRRERPEREAAYEFKQMCGEAGTIALFDTGLWHKGGVSTPKDRWSLCSYYGPWFVKPYFRFPEMLGQAFGEGLRPELRRLFHYHSTPPLHEDERRNTLVRE